MIRPPPNTRVLSAEALLDEFLSSGGGATEERERSQGNTQSSLRDGGNDVDANEEARNGSEKKRRDSIKDERGAFDTFLDMMFDRGSSSTIASGKRDEDVAVEAIAASSSTLRNNPSSRNEKALHQQGTSCKLPPVKQDEEDDSLEEDEDYESDSEEDKEQNEDFDERKKKKKKPITTTPSMKKPLRATQASTTTPTILSMLPFSPHMSSNGDNQQDDEDEEEEDDNFDTEKFWNDGTVRIETIQNAPNSSSSSSASTTTRIRAMVGKRKDADASSESSTAKKTKSPIQRGVIGAKRRGKRRNQPVSESRSPHPPVHDWNEHEVDDDHDDDDYRATRPYFPDSPANDEPSAPLVLNARLGIRVPATTNRYLRMYQREGVQFMYSRLQLRRGGILNDDMGLGKTIQIIAFLSAIYYKTGKRGVDGRRVERRVRRRKTAEARLELGANREEQVDDDEEAENDWVEVEPSLIIVPSAVRNNWLREIQTWGWFDVVTVGGEKGSGAEAARANAIAWCACPRPELRPEILLTTYKMAEKYKTDLSTIPFKVAVMDEVHTLKNEKAQITEGVRAALEMTRCRIGLTGTLFQNRLMELYTILNTVQPGCLGTPIDFKHNYSDAIYRSRCKDATETEVAVGSRRAATLKALLDVGTKKLRLRRTKAQCLSDVLPTKFVHIVFCRLAPAQSETYKRILNSRDGVLLARMNEKCDCGRSGSQDTRGRCCHRSDANAPLWRYLHLKIKDERHKKRKKRETGKDLYQITLEDCDRCPSCIQFPLLAKLVSCATHLELLKLRRADEDDDDDDEEEEAMTRGPKREADEGALAQEVEDDDNGENETRNDRLNNVRDLTMEEAVDKEEKEKRRCEEEFVRVALGEDAEIVGGIIRGSNFMELSSDEHCGKLRVLSRLLEVWSQNAAKRNKVLIFSEYARVLDILQKFVGRRGYKYCRLDGKTSSSKRLQLVDQFNSDPNVFLFLATTGAGGVGLNLTAANIVVMFDTKWNPAVDSQAQDRAYRYGQRRDVDVYRLIATGTVEEMMLTRQIYKTQLERSTLEGVEAERRWRGVMESATQKGDIFGIENLLQYKEEGGFMTELGVMRGEGGKKLGGIEEDDVDGEEEEERDDENGATSSFSSSAVSPNAKSARERRKRVRQVKREVSKLKKATGLDIETVGEERDEPSQVTKIAMEDEDDESDDDEEEEDEANSDIEMAEGLLRAMGGEESLPSLSVPTETQAGDENDDDEMPSTSQQPSISPTQTTTMTTSPTSKRASSSSSTLPVKGTRRKNNNKGKSSRSRVKLDSNLDDVVLGPREVEVEALTEDEEEDLDDEGEEGKAVIEGRRDRRGSNGKRVSIPSSSSSRSNERKRAREAAIDTVENHRPSEDEEIADIIKGHSHAVLKGEAAYREID